MNARQTKQEHARTIFWSLDPTLQLLKSRTTTCAQALAGFLLTTFHAPIPQVDLFSSGTRS
jgi:hypothetical protein